MFRILDIPCDAQGVRHKESGKSEGLLMDYVENYFQSGVEDPTQHIRKTNLPPLYFQHLGSSPCSFPSLARNWLTCPCQATP